MPSCRKKGPDRWRPKNRIQYEFALAAYILDTFPIVRRHDEAAFGHYRTKTMVLAYFNALAAGDTSTDVAV